MPLEGVFSMPRRFTPKPIRLRLRRLTKHWQTPRQHRLRCCHLLNAALALLVQPYPPWAHPSVCLPRSHPPFPTLSPLHTEGLRIAVVYALPLQIPSGLKLPLHACPLSLPWQVSWLHPCCLSKRLELFTVDHLRSPSAREEWSGDYQLNMISLAAVLHWITHAHRMQPTLICFM